MAATTEVKKRAVRKAPASAAPAEGGGSVRRAALVELAAELFARQGFKATTVREIADAAGVLSGSLYHHFDSKESIIDELLSSYLEELLAEYRAIMDRGGRPVDVLRNLVRAAFDSFGKHQAAIVVMQNERQHLSQLERFKYLPEAETEVDKMWTGVIKKGIEVGDFRSDLDPTVIYRVIRDAIWVAGKWYKPGGRFSPEQLADQYLAVFTEGIGGPSQVKGRAAR